MTARPVPVSSLDYDGQGGNRTPDTRIFSPLLYQLSYLARLQLLQARRTFRQPVQ